ncbi:SAM-dependent methyltransferase [Anaplasma marginale]|uniref:class I SAM-dependent methyltransferase n=1 Tax=Anaplasma marginale TaxID=770 RepID=UPI000DF0150C|nr:SAM-dependent methyltransferase [Anaplasma marginale]KAA8473148.1 SAM-dependent methyltransferase [Anaplasma marginale]KAB0451508.1 SAM-dependent methyltransferase [Anaplasma marginale]RCL20177.1 SAM-dependent methyltransferase [Anaplasma marginale]TZF79224.1 SAM-dependent methyltransferase [Anaplasma marginale]
MGFCFKKFIFENSAHVTMDRFMSLALYHEEHGYYMTRVPFGRAGDFVTSAEISQLFGEVIALWILSCLESAGISEKFSLLELGPGRGTLMHDILRVFEQFPRYDALLEVHLLEISPLLRNTQRATLESFSARKEISWHCKLEELPERPTIVVANEFFDALPVRQFIRTGGAWKECCVCNDGGNLGIVAVDTQYNLDGYGDVPEGGIIERCEAASDVLACLEKIIVRNGGAAAIFDYGYLQPPYRSTIQSVKSHHYCDFLDNIGECDITAHVDFGLLQKHAQRLNSKVVTQREFLYQFGIRERLACLERNATERQRRELKGAFLRLTENMGTMFKVLLLNHERH